MKLTIVGGGIGGLAAALALQPAGVEVAVFERSHASTELGTGMTLWPNATRVLNGLGVLPELKRVARDFVQSAVGDANGRVWARMPMGDVARAAGFPTLLVSRRELHRVLSEAVAARVGPVVHAGHALERFEVEEAQVRADFSGGANAEADGLLGADGVSSVTRAQLFGARPLVFQGRTSCRGLSEDVELPADTPDFVERHGAVGRFAFYRVGGTGVAWYANVLRRIDRSEDALEVLRRAFAGWAEPVPSLLARATSERLHVTPIADLEPLEAWTRGPVALLGDAAHPMTPDLGQGAGQALEDAAALGRAFASKPGSVTEAFAQYEAARRARASGLQRNSRKVGRLANLGGVTGLLVRRAMWSLMPPRVAVARMSRLVQDEVSDDSHKA